MNRSMNIAAAALAGVTAGFVMLSGSAAAVAADEPVTATSTVPVAATGSATASTGLAAVYSDKLNGHVTASGQKYDRDKLTAAHKTLPFGTKVKVTNAKNGKSVVVRINDRGPKQAERILDLSPRAARALGIGRFAMAEVSVETVN